MDLLIDTHSLIWFLNGDERLSNTVKNLIEDTDNVKLVSIASVWEIAIKISLNKFRFEKGLKHFLSLIEDNGFVTLPITFEHAMIVSTLEFIHRDPFDRLLIAQCKVDNLTLLTKDDAVKQYNIKTIW